MVIRHVVGPGGQTSRESSFLEMNLAWDMAMEDIKNNPCSRGSVSVEWEPATVFYTIKAGPKMVRFEISGE